MFNSSELDEIIRLKVGLLENSLAFTEADINQVKKLYNGLMKENRNIKYNDMEQTVLIETLIEEVEMYRSSSDYTRNQAFTRIFNEHGDNSHLSYYDNFLNKGESEKIIKALTKIGKSTNVLMGVKKLQDCEIKNDGVTIYQKIGSNELGSLYVEEFRIEYNGKTIYEFKGTESYKYDENDNIYDNDFTVYDIIENVANSLEGSAYTKKALKKINVNTKDSKESYYFFVKKNGDVYIRKTVNGAWSK